MRGIFSTIAMFVWALWLGGLVTLVISVTVLFKGDRSIAVDAAPMLFRAFERYQLVLAAVALVTTLGWRLGQKSLLVMGVFAFFALATVGAVVSTTVISRKMHDLREHGQRESAEFQRLHKQSEKVYSGTALCLVGAGIVLPLALKRADKLASPSHG